MNSNLKIDIDYVAALRVVKNSFESVTLDIKRPTQFITELKAMVDNPERTVWDMMSLFTEHYPKNSRYIDYLAPYGYSSSYVSGPSYPEIKPYEQLKEEWETAGIAAKKRYEQSCLDNHVAFSDSTASEEQKKAIVDVKSRQKSFFIERAIRWINACEYQSLCSSLSRRVDIKMYSKENIGWNNFEYPLNDDIKIVLNTNFGYGSSAYFLLSVRYKGIDILPYSYIVRYYKAGMADIIRCTRKYSPDRGSWAAAFDFIANFANEASSDPETFVRTYIMNEVREMMQGLKEIANNPNVYMEKICNVCPELQILSVRCMMSGERTKVKTYPGESQILFKVEKITGALDFLDSLNKVASIIDEIRPYINQLREMNYSLCPEITNAMSKIAKYIEQEECSIKSLKKTQSAMIKKMAPYEEEIEKLKKDSKKGKNFDMSTYENTHVEYRKAKSEKRELDSQINKHENTLGDYQSFYRILENSVKKINGLRVAV
jgi:hypothetical protein